MKEQIRLQRRDLLDPEKVCVFNNFHFNHFFVDIPQFTKYKIF